MVSTSFRCPVRPVLYRMGTYRSIVHDLSRGWSCCRDTFPVVVLLALPSCNSPGITEAVISSCAAHEMKGGPKEGREAMGGSELRARARKARWALEPGSLSGNPLRFVSAPPPDPLLPLRPAMRSLLRKARQESHIGHRSQVPQR
jgi:hypothetical protein